MTCSKISMAVAALIGVASVDNVGAGPAAAAARADDCARQAETSVPAPATEHGVRSLQRAIDDALKRVFPSVVRIVHDPKYGPGSASGVVIGKDGVILTCAHSPGEVGEPVKVEFPNGCSVEGKWQAKLRADKFQDLAVIQLDSKGPWPAVRIGTAEDLTKDDQLVFIGYPFIPGVFGAARRPPPLVRVGHLIETISSRHANLICTSVQATGGDSGGPLFDLGGRLIGITSSGTGHATGGVYTKIDVLRREWEELMPGRAAPSAAIPARPVAGSSVEATAEKAAALRRGVVEVRSGDRWVLFGCVVDHGLILTKASELGPNLTVLLENDIVAVARAAASDHVRDLALLQVAADLTEAIPPIRWNDVEDLPPGAVVAVATPPEFTPPAGVVCHGALASPGVPGVLPVYVKDGDGGVEVVKQWEQAQLQRTWLRAPAFPIRSGDVITAVEGARVVDQRAFTQLFEGDVRKILGRHPCLAGERINVTVRREGQTTNEMVRLFPYYTMTTQLVLPTSYRFTGFPRAIATDVSARPEHCGAPVVDASGRVVGVLIARAMDVVRLVLPASEVRASLEEMRKQIAISSLP